MRWLCSILALLLLSASAQAATLHANLIRASNEAKDSDPMLREWELSLRQKFGYRSYGLLGSGFVTIKEDVLQRINVGEGFTVFVKQKAAKDRKHELEIEWYSGKASLVKTTVNISAGRSVFINGPAVGKQLIILSLTVRN